MIDLEQQAAHSKRAFKQSLKAYLNQFDEFTDTPDMSAIVQSMKPIIFQEAMGLVSHKKHLVAQVLGVNRGVLAKTLKSYPHSRQGTEPFVVLDKIDN